VRAEFHIDGIQQSASETSLPFQSKKIARNRIMNKFLAVALLSALATPAFADSSNLSGLYAGATLGTGSASFSAPVGSGLVVDNTKSRPVYGVFGGYRYTPNLAAELAYTGVSYIYTTAAGTRYLSKQIAFSLTAVGSYPINDVFSIYGKLGVASSSSENDSVGEQNTRRFGPTFGAGAEYRITPKIAARLGIDSYAVAATIPTVAPAVKQSSTATVVNAGLSYSF